MMLQMKWGCCAGAAVRWNWSSGRGGSEIPTSLSCTGLWMSVMGHVWFTSGFSHSRTSSSFSVKDLIIFCKNINVTVYQILSCTNRHRGTPLQMLSHLQFPECFKRERRGRRKVLLQRSVQHFPRARPRSHPLRSVSGFAVPASWTLLC